MTDELKHVGVLGMKWGRRKGSSDDSGSSRASTSVRGKITPSSTSVRGKITSERRMANLKGVLKKKIKSYEPMGEADKKAFKRIGIALGTALGIVGSVALTSHLANRYLEKREARKVADAIGKMLITRRPISSD